MASIRYFSVVGEFSRVKSNPLGRVWWKIGAGDVADRHVSTADKHKTPANSALRPRFARAIVTVSPLAAGGTDGLPGADFQIASAAIIRNGDAYHLMCSIENCFSGLAA